MTFLENLKRLDAEANLGPWTEDGDSIYRPKGIGLAISRVGIGPRFNEVDAKLICLLRNSASTIIELVEAAEITLDQAPVSDLVTGRINLTALRQALSKLKEDV